MKKDYFSMSALPVGYKAKVCELIDSGRNITERLRDLGISEGEEVMCVMKSPLGEPCSYMIKGSVIALRQEDAGVVRLFSDSVARFDRERGKAKAIWARN